MKRWQTPSGVFPPLAQWPGIRRHWESLIDSWEDEEKHVWLSNGRLVRSTTQWHAHKLFVAALHFNGGASLQSSCCHDNLGLHVRTCTAHPQACTSIVLRTTRGAVSHNQHVGTACVCCGREWGLEMLQGFVVDVKKKIKILKSYEKQGHILH